MTASQRLSRSRPGLRTAVMGAWAGVAESRSERPLRVDSRGSIVAQRTAGIGAIEPLGLVGLNEYCCPYASFGIPIRIGSVGWKRGIPDLPGM
jgi:hypothetical protein